MLTSGARDLVHAADPEVVETIKCTVRPYFVLDGNICALLATKDHANGFLYDGEGTGADVRPDHREQPRGRLAQLKK